MLSQIAAIRSSFPSAFSALGVGCVGILGQLPLGSVLRSNFPVVSLRLGSLDLPTFILPALPFAAAFSAFFYVYVMGLVFIATAGRFRSPNPQTEAERLAQVFECGNEAAIKFWFEQRALVEAFDGRSLSVGISGLSIAMAFFLDETRPLWAVLFVTAVGFSGMCVCWREAGKGS